MPPGVRLLAPGLLLLFTASGCPVTDDYYIESSHGSEAGSGHNSAGESASTAGSASLGGSANGGSNPAGGSVVSAAGSLGAGGSVDLPVAGAPDEAGASSGTCLPATERCNGHDDDCDELVDELACNAADGCSGFVDPKLPNHGYMLCTQKKDYGHAQAACAAQNMRLAWLETEAENSAVAKKVDALTTETEVVFGANDIANEGKWMWDGGPQFWSGNEDGAPVGGLFNAWVTGAPNDANNNEDCVTLNPMTAVWGDRNCAATYVYLCEEEEAEL